MARARKELEEDPTLIKPPADHSYFDPAVEGDEPLAASTPPAHADVSSLAFAAGGPPPPLPPPGAPTPLPFAAGGPPPPLPPPGAPPQGGGGPPPPPPPSANPPAAGADSGKKKKEKKSLAEIAEERMRKLEQKRQASMQP